MSSSLEDLVNMVEGVELPTSQFSGVSALRTRLLNALVALGLQSGGGSGGLTLVENKTVDSGAATITFSGLDGDTDIKYRMIGNCLVTTNPSNLALNPNGLATNLIRSGLRINSGGTGNLNSTDWTLNGDTLGATQCCFAVDIFATKLIGAQALRRYFVGNSVCLNSSNQVETLILSGQWL